MQLLPLVSLALALVSFATPMPSSRMALDVFGPMTTKHAWVNVPPKWDLISPAPDAHILRLRIGLKQSNIDSLIGQLYEISDPTHVRYGQHLSKEEVEALVQPASESVEAVESWLAAHGLDINSPECAMERSAAGDWINLNVPVRLAEKMLNTEYNVYQHKRDVSHRVVRALSYSLPRSLHDHVDVITPTTMFGTMRSMKSTIKKVRPSVKTSGPEVEPVTMLMGPSGLAVPSSCNNEITPTCLQDLYGTSAYTPVSTAVNSMGITGYLEQFASFSDLKTFAEKFRPAADDATFTVVEFNGGENTQSDPGDEANLDVQTATGLIFPTPLIFYSTGGSPPFIPDSETPTDTNEPYDQWVAGLLQQSSIPGVISTSYGDDEQTVPLDFATSVCNSFAQIGARGVSLLFASGDNGVGGGNCESNNGTDAVVFQPNFPASCPFVTTVGATEKITEVAASFSGGGFSNYFAQPTYQTTAVKTFLTALGTEFTGLFNKSGRAYPDVSAQGVNFEIILDGDVEEVDGTSCATPTFSSIVTLLNDFRISKGNTTLGFLNPLLYNNPSALNDIKSGSNAGCKTNGFTARTGWDPVTGLGTPNFANLQKIVV